MSDLDALLAAVIAHPADDVPRLLYADELDEAAGRLTDRAELIRVQIALSKCADRRPFDTYRAFVVAATYPVSLEKAHRLAEEQSKILDLEKREAELFAADWLRWADLRAFALRMCAADYGPHVLLWPNDRPLVGPRPGEPDRCELGWQRGFVHSLTSKPLLLLPLLCDARATQPIRVVRFDEYHGGVLTFHYDHRRRRKPIGVSVGSHPPVLRLSAREFRAADGNLWKTRAVHCRAWEATFPGLTFSLPPA